MTGSRCPRCQAMATTCLGHSLCRGDKHDRWHAPSENLIEYACQECGLFWKQFEPKEMEE